MPHNFDEETRLLIAEYGLGLDADLFFSSDIGRYVLGRVDLEVKEAIQSLKSVPCTDSQKIMELQNKINVAESVPKWLNEAIINGRNAQTAINEEQGE